MEKDCENWLHENLPAYLDIFIENDFKTLKSIAIVNNEDLKDMGILSVGKRKEILSQTVTLQRPTSLTSRNLSSAGADKSTLQTCKYHKSIILFTHIVVNLLVFIKYSSITVHILITHNHN